MKIKILLSLIIISCVILVSAQDATKEKNLDIYGFVMTDAGYNFGQTDPNWYDVLRTSKLPAYENQWGTDGNAYFSVRQTRFGIKSYNKTSLGDLYTIFEFELFGYIRLSRFKVTDRLPASLIATIFADEQIPSQLNKKNIK